MPLISDSWRKHFTWRGSGDFPSDERAKLAQIVQRGHAAGRLIRFWGTPDNVAMWRVLRDAGVNQINTDDLAGLSQFLAEQ